MSNRYVPDIAPGDGDDTRWALETANTLFVQGEWREALRWVRRAAEAAAEAGQDSRALQLAKSVSELRARIDIPRTLPPAPPLEPIDGPLIVIPGPAAVPAVVHDGMNGPASLGVVDGTPPVVPRSEAPASRSSAVDPAEGQRAASFAQTASAVSRVPSSPQGAAGAAQTEQSPVANRPDDELVVTVVSTDGTIPARNAAFISHRALRVAIFPAGDDDRQYLVRPLGAGEVAPQDSTVGLLVAFEAGASPLPET